MKRTLFYVLGIFFSVVPPTLATLFYFPLWIASGAHATVSGLCLFLLTLCALPLLRYLKEPGRSPSLPTLWGIVYLLVRALSAIIEQLLVISFVGLLSNLVGALFFRLSKRGERT